MKRYIKSSTTEHKRQLWYRCVKHDADPKKFNSYELGIHCGSFEQAQYIDDAMYNGSGDIYEVEVRSDSLISEVVSDFESWNSVEAIYEILSVGFGLDISRQEITQDLREGVFDRTNASAYIKDMVGQDNLLVKYHNSVELNEDNIIVLDDSCIQKINLLN